MCGACACEFLLVVASYRVPVAYANSLLHHNVAYDMHCANYLNIGDTQKYRVNVVSDTIVRHALLPPRTAATRPLKARTAQHSTPPEHTQRLAAVAGHPGRSQGDHPRPPARPQQARPHEHKAARDEPQPPPHAAASAATPTAVLPKVPAMIAAVAARSARRILLLPGTCTISSSDDTISSAVLQGLG